MLVAVCCLLSVVRSLMVCVVYEVVFVVCWMWFVVCCLMRGVCFYCLLFVCCMLRLHVLRASHCLLRVACGLSAVACCLLLVA